MSQKNAFPSWTAYNEMTGIGGWRNRTEQAGPHWYIDNGKLASDASPVVGRDGGVPEFYWLAGQGGYGIKTSPALSRACASLIRDRRLPDDLTRLGITETKLSPDRLRMPLGKV